MSGPKANVHATSPKHREIQRARHGAIERASKRETRASTRVLTELALLRRVADAARCFVVARTDGALGELTAAVTLLDS